MLGIGALVFLLWAGGFAVYLLSVSQSIPSSTHSKIFDVRHSSPQVVVVFVGGQHRIAEGIDLFQRLQEAANSADGAEPADGMLYISGVDDHIAVAFVEMMLSSLPKRTRTCCIVVDDISTTTRENAIQTAAWLDSLSTQPSHVILVSSPFHLPRARMLLRHYDGDDRVITLWPAVYPRRRGVGAQWLLYLQEYHKLMLQWLVLRVS